MEQPINNNPANYTEEDNLMNPDQDIETMTPEMLIGAKQNNQDQQPINNNPNFTSKNNAPINNAPINNAPVKKAPSKAPVIIILLLLIVGSVVAGILFLKNKKNQQQALLQQQQQAEQESIAQQEEFERMRREEAEMEALFNEEPEIQEDNNSSSIDVKLPNFYTKEEIKKMIFAGFDPEEIEVLAENKTPVDEVLKKVNDGIKGYVEEQRRKIKEDPDEWLGKWTTFGQWETTLDIDTNIKEKTYHQNVTFEKAPLYGLQTYLKLYLNADNDNEYVMWNCDPLLYMTLKQTGALTVSYRYRMRPGTAGYWVYDIQLDDELIKEQMDAKAIELKIPE